jgi:hypothetical protein
VRGARRGGRQAHAADDVVAGGDAGGGGHGGGADRGERRPAAGYGRSAAALVSSAAFAACAAYVGVRSAAAHPRAPARCASRLWLVCEKYRALIAEMHEGRIDLATLRERRNALLQEAAQIFEHAAPSDRYTLEIARRSLRARSGSPVVPACDRRGGLVFPVRGRCPSGLPTRSLARLLRRPRDL